MKTRSLPLGSFAEFRNGINYIVGDQGDTVGIVGVGDFRGRSLLIDFSKLTKVTISGSLSPEDQLRDGDILLVRSNGNKDLIGRSLIIRNPPKGVSFSGFTIRVRVDPTVALPEFVALIFQGDVIKSHLLLAGGGNGNIANLNQSTLRDIELPIPALSTQKDILAVISAWDTAIESTERLITAKEEQYAGLINRLIIRKSREETWARKRLYEIADRIQRQSDGDKYTLLTISSASGFVRQEEKYSRYMAGESAKTYTLLKRGEFAYNKGNSLRYEYGCVFQLLDYDAALVPSVYVSFCLQDSVSDNYMRHLFAADYLKPQLRALVKTGVRNNGLLNIRPDEFMSTTVPLPPIAEQEQIATVLDEAREEIRLLTELLEKQRIQKRGLMQKLLTGKWRVPSPDGVSA